MQQVLYFNVNVVDCVACVNVQCAERCWLQFVVVCHACYFDKPNLPVCILCKEIQQAWPHCVVVAPLGDNPWGASFSWTNWGSRYVGYSCGRRQNSCETARHVRNEWTVYRIF